jgi:hypothetical protein
LRSGHPTWTVARTKRMRTVPPSPLSISSPLHADDSRPGAKALRFPHPQTQTQERR